MNELQCLSECTKFQGQGYVPQAFYGKATGEGSRGGFAVCQHSPGLRRTCWPALLTLWLSLQPSVEALEPNVS